MRNESIAIRKVLHIIDSFGGGGAETWLLATVKYLNQHPELNMQFDFLASGGKEGIYDEEIKQLGSEIFYYKYSLKKIFSFSKQFKNILKQNKYIAVHNHQDFISGWHFLCGIGQLPAIRISHLHNSYNFTRNYVINPLRSFSFRAGRLLMAILATKITGTSNAVMDEYRYDKYPFKKKRVQPAYCGLETEKFGYSQIEGQKVKITFGWKPEDKIALFAGRIGLHEYDKGLNEKNPVFAFELAKKLLKKDSIWKFIFAGFKGNLGEEMENETRKLGLDDSIKFIGLSNNMPALFSAADVFVFPSLWEGLGMVAVEAQASGLYVIVSDTVPAEALIIKELIEIKSVAENVDGWVKAIVNLKRKTFFEREKYNIDIKNSVFSIEYSVQNLLNLYY